MKLLSKKQLKEFVLYSPHPQADQINFAVQDVMSISNIMGFLTYSPRARWSLNSDETLFVDDTPVIPGARLLVWSSPAPIALHSPSPHPCQAFHFGAHRMIKALQRDIIQAPYSKCSAMETSRTGMVGIPEAT